MQAFEPGIYYLKMLRERLNKAYTQRGVLYDMSLKQLKEKYAGSKFGIWWAVITPVILAVSINFVFVSVFKIGIQNYTLFVLAGILPWFFFNNALSEATDAFIVHSSILQQGIFPREFIPVSSVLANLFNFCIGLIILLPVFIVLNPKMILLLPLLFILIILHFIFTLGLGLFCSSLGVYLRDLKQFLSIIFMFWFWITPVFYSLEMVDKRFQWVCLSNPMTYYINAYQNILFKSASPSMPQMLLIFAGSLISVIIGLTVFFKCEPGLLKRI